MWNFSWTKNRKHRNFVKRYAQIIILITSILLIYMIPNSNLFRVVDNLRYDISYSTYVSKSNINDEIIEYGHYMTENELDIVIVNQYMAALSFIRSIIWRILILIPVLILVSWKSYIDNKLYGYWVNLYTLVFFLATIIGFDFSTLFVSHSIGAWFECSILLDIFLIVTIIYNISYYKNNKQKFEYGPYCKSSAYIKTTIFITVFIVLVIVAFYTFKIISVFNNKELYYDYKIYK